MIRTTSLPGRISPCLPLNPRLRGARSLPRHRNTTLRARLLLRLGALLLVMLLLALTIAAAWTGLLDAVQLGLVVILLLITGGGLLHAILALVQSNLLDPLAGVDVAASVSRHPR